MKILTVIGTRPEIIRLSLIIKKLDACSEHVLVHTGQNFSESLNDIFFKELGIRSPDYYLGAKPSMFGEQVSIILREIEKIFLDVRPDKVLILGDTNSGLSAVAAERLGIPVYHMEAGNRCFDMKVPEEINRRVIDSVSSFALPYTVLSRENLLREGISKARILVCGNPIYEVMDFFMDKINRSCILEILGVKEKQYFLATVHRAENVDKKERLEQIIRGIMNVGQQHNIPVIMSVHPRTRSRMEQFCLKAENSCIRFMEPFGFLDFVKLEKHAVCVLTDSGTVQEECCILGVPTVTVRDTTERPETVECGSNIVSGINPARIAECTKIMLSSSKVWTCPDGYAVKNVSERVAKFILGNYEEIGLY